MSPAINAALNYFLIRLRHFFANVLTANHYMGCLNPVLFKKKSKLPVLIMLSAKV